LLAVGRRMGAVNDRATGAGISPALLSREELLRGAAELVPVLKSRATRTEQLRQIPAETVQDLRDSGLIRIGNPRRYGGHDVEVDTAFDVGFELGRGCGSTACATPCGPRTTGGSATSPSRPRRSSSRPDPTPSSPAASIPP